jgi:hypothetical protein
MNTAAWPWNIARPFGSRGSGGGSKNSPAGCQTLKFSIRDLLLVTVIAAILLAWWVDHGRQGEGIPGVEGAVGATTQEGAGEGQVPLGHVRFSGTRPDDAHKWWIEELPPQDAKP